MPIDFKALQAKSQKELESQGSSENRTDFQYPFVYTGPNGKLTVRLFYNEKSNAIQRRIVRHAIDSEGKKAVCLQEYGEDCPICDAIKRALEVDEKCGAKMKYGYKIRGVCFAQVIDHEATYFTEDGDPKKGDIITLMYPKTVYDQINRLIVNSGDNLYKLIGSNNGFAVVIEKISKGKNIPEFKVSLDAFRGEFNAFDSDEKYEEEVSKLPSLDDLFYPPKPTDEIRTTVQAAADAIRAEYLGSKVVNPSTPKTTPAPTKVEEVKEPLPFEESDDDLPFEVEEPSETETKDQNTSVSKPSEDSEYPPCFGKHDDNSSKCILCSYEAECQEKHG